MKLSFVCVCLFLCSCFTERTANKQLERVQKKYPNIVAKKCADNFRIDTLTITKTDTLITVTVDTFEKIYIDTISKNVIVERYINKWRTIVKTESKIVENKAALYYVQYNKTKDSINFVKKEAAYVREVQLKTEKIKSTRRNNIKLWIFIALLLLWILRKPIMSIIKL